MKRLLFIGLSILTVVGCDINIKARPNDSAGAIDSLISKIVRIDTLYRVDTVIKETERLRVDTVVTSVLDTIVKVKVDTLRVSDTIVKVDTIYKQIYKTDTLFKVDTVTKKDTLFQWWTSVDTIFKRDTLVIHDTVTKSIRDTISAKVILLKDTLLMRVGDTTRLQFGDSLIIPIKVLPACTATGTILKSP